MKTTISPWTALNFLFCFFLTSLATAQEVKIINPFQGEIISHDDTLSTVTVKRIVDEKNALYELLELRVTDETKITKNGRSIETRKLFPGDQAFIRSGYDRQGREMAIFIHVGQPGSVSSRLLPPKSSKKKRRALSDPDEAENKY